MQHGRPNGRTMLDRAKLVVNPTLFDSLAGALSKRTSTKDLDQGRQIPKYVGIFQRFSSTLKGLHQVYPNRLCFLNHYRHFLILYFNINPTRLTIVYVVG